MAGREDALEEKMFSRVKEGISQPQDPRNKTDVLCVLRKMVWGSNGIRMHGKQGAWLA